MHRKVMEAWIIIHNIVIDVRRDYNVSKLYNEGLTAVERVCLLDEDGNDKHFKWLSNNKKARLELCTCRPFSACIILFIDCVLGLHAAAVLEQLLQKRLRFLINTVHQLLRCVHLRFRMMGTLIVSSRRSCTYRVESLLGKLTMEKMCSSFNREKGIGAESGTWRLMDVRRKIKLHVTVSVQPHAKRFTSKCLRNWSFRQEIPTFFSFYWLFRWMKISSIFIKIDEFHLYQKRIKNKIK